MDIGLSSEQIAGGIYGLLLLGLALVQFFNARRKPPASASQDPIVTGFGAGFGPGLQMERLIEQTARVADQITRVGDVLAGKQVDDAFGTVNQKIADLTAELEKALSKPRSMMSRARKRPPPY